MISEFRAILTERLGEAVGLNAPWLESVMIGLGKGLLNAAWCCESDVSG